MRALRAPGVNNLEGFGRRGIFEQCDAFAIE